MNLQVAPIIQAMEGFYSGLAPSGIQLNGSMKICSLYMYVCTYARRYVFMSVRLYACMYGFMYSHIHKYKCLYLEPVYVCMYVRT